MRCGIPSSTIVPSQMSSQDRFSTLLAAPPSQHSVNIFPEVTQFRLSHPTTISRRRSMKLTSVIFAAQWRLGLLQRRHLHRIRWKAASGLQGDIEQQRSASS